MAVSRKIGKQELIEMTAAKANEDIDITKKDTAIVVNALIDSMLSALGDGNDVTFFNFGSFKIKKAKARKCVSIDGGGIIKIPAHNRIAFTAGKLMREAINTKRKKRK